MSDKCEKWMTKATASKETLVAIVGKFLPILIGEAYVAFDEKTARKLCTILDAVWEAAPDAGWIHSIPGWATLCNLCADGPDLFDDEHPYVEAIKVIKIDPGMTVLCDFCNEDYTASEMTGGILFGSKAACPKCAPGIEQRAKEYGEEKHIKARCPEAMSFAEWVRGIRVASDLAHSGLVPDRFKGKVADCAVVLDAARKPAGSSKEGTE